MLSGALRSELPLAFFLFHAPPVFISSLLPFIPPIFPSPRDHKPFQSTTPGTTPHHLISSYTHHTFLTPHLPSLHLTPRTPSSSLPSKNTKHIKPKPTQTNTPLNNSIMALSLSTTVILVWLPYCLKGCKNVQHHCGNASCDALLATWHRTLSPGSTEVQAWHRTLSPGGPEVKDFH